jgi:muconate cycloisomerase
MRMRMRGRGTINKATESGQTEVPAITRIELTPVLVPFWDTVREAMQSGEGGLGMAIAAEEPWPGGDFVICKLVADDGTVGLGEAMLWLPETGASPEQIISIIRDFLYRYVIGENPFDLERINHRMDINVARNEVAKGLLDMACYDLMGKVKGCPAYDLMGGRQISEVPLAALIPLMNTEAMLWLTRGFFEAGWRTFRFKLGRSIGEDVEIIGSMREALGDDVRMRVDYNQAYSPEDAVRAIKAIEPYGIDFAEQPVDANDYVAMAKVQKRVGTPLMAHEGCFSLQDIKTLVALGAVGVVGLNSERPGGITKALQAIAFAEERGLGAVLHNQTLGIASAAQLHIAAAKHDSLGHATELFGHVMLEDDLIVEPIDYSGGTATVTEGAGWGVQLDEAALVKYATGPTVVIKEG